MKHTGIWLLVIIMYQVEKCYCSGASRLWIHQVRELVPVRLGHTLGLLVLKTSGRNSQETVFKLGYILAFFFLIWGIVVLLCSITTGVNI